MPPFGALLLDPAKLWLIASGLMPAQGVAPVVPVPASPVLIGQTVYWQGLTGSPLRFTNREQTTLTGL